MRRILVFPLLLCIAAIIVVVPGTRLGDAANRFGRHVFHWAREV